MTMELGYPSEVSAPEPPQTRSPTIHRVEGTQATHDPSRVWREE